MLIEVEFDRYQTPALTESQCERLKQVAIVAPSFDPNEPGKLQWSHTSVIFSIDQLAHFPGVRVVRTIDNDSTRALMSFGQRSTTVVNSKCNVAVAGLGLLTVNEVELHCDLCTDALQAALDKGWRILAVCVQPDQRRPDYILGRTTKSSADD